MNTTVESWGMAITGSLQLLWSRFINFLPQLVIAIITLLVGWVIASVLGTLVEKLVKTLYIDQGLEKIGLKEGMKKGGLKLDSGAFLGGVVKWFFIFVFLMAFADILNLNQVTSFLNDILMYIPNIIVATLILIFAALVANFLYYLIKSSVKAAGLRSANFLAGLAKWSILVLSFIMALGQLGVDTALLQTLLTGIIGMIAIAGGLAFGLGGKDAAEDLIKKIKSNL